ncbi:Type 1 glutamine amidotransferase-like domain-containing protein [Candidatus Dojkabacteria bacterium]|uniref:Type 1 glutamine amidotransferase-like domain-containing protein n=2 Tax=Candidatus Dojkabacteria TaxID=74243 RepID=A0A952AJ35_9BACT|nr:MAG: putative peptidase [candidate division WS6 bacterium OLB21]MBW7954066.1 Type 1 glutamine amidotransferase-like domain-containing protein [Candidatus Dojkabacteria bacterium]
MKLLLTSAGLTNKSIIMVLENMVGKSANRSKLAFVPTAANIEPGDKSWLIEDMQNCVSAGFELDIVDISALPQKHWLPRLDSADVLLFGGGNTFHLMHWFMKSGLQNLLPDLLQTRIYVGISAGSCITGSTIYNSVQNLFREKYDLEIKEGLGLVNFQTIPHLNSPHFDRIKETNLDVASKEISEQVYALDDNSAIMVKDHQVEVISEGNWLKYN